MALLPDADRAAGTAQFLRDEKLSFANLVKADIRAAFNGVDQGFHDNANAINLWFPQPARSQFTTEQKARILMEVIRRRYLAGV